MARRPNYSHVKRQKELEKQKKQEAKAERKRLKREEEAGGGEAVTAEEGEMGAEPADAAIE